MKPDRKKWPNLARDWDAYGHQIAWDQLFDFKSNGSYIALAWKEDDGSVNYADLATATGAVWEMQNDSHEPVTLKEWKALRTVPECDWLVTPKGEMA